MRQVGQRLGSLACVLLSVGVVWTTDVGAQEVPRERAVPGPVAEWSRGFTSIISVRELDGGRTLVADRGENRLYLVNWETGDLDEVLREGEGPGEHRGIGWLYRAGDGETLLTDLGGSRWILLRDIDPVHTFNDAAPLNMRFQSLLDGVATDGGVLAAVSAENPGWLLADGRVLELASGLGPHDALPRLDTIRRIRGSGRSQIACVLATRMSSTGPDASWSG